MTKPQLSAVIDALVRVVDSRETAGDLDGFRPLVMTLHSDGSGRIGFRDPYASGRFEAAHQFDDIDELVEELQAQGVEFTE